VTKHHTWEITFAIFLLSVAVASPAQDFTSLFSFGVKNGEEPTYVSLVQGRDGEFYGTTSQGGDQSGGTVFKITAQGTLTSLYSFCFIGQSCTSGYGPMAGLVQGVDGNFYGTTELGGEARYCGGPDGCGTLFSVTPDGAFTTLHSFCALPGCADGSYPIASLAEGLSGRFYGTTLGGGKAGDGEVYSITAKGGLTTIYTFCSLPNCSDGNGPRAGLILGTDGELYGTTSAGGANSQGTIFSLSETGRLKTLYSFCSQPNCTDGAAPFAGVVQGTDGNFYGVTFQGGDLECNPPSGCGTVYEVTRAGVLTTLHTFEGPYIDGANPTASLVQGTDGNLYGTTALGGTAQCYRGGSACGTLFSIAPHVGLTLLHSFDASDGAEPSGGLVEGTNGSFYGTTTLGGSGDANSGTVFSLDMKLSPFVTFLQPFGRVSQTGGILGQGFTGTTSVMLNGVPASFNVISDTFIRATVPSGATTGYVTVTTPTGVLTSNVQFHVIP
jgi:uncharacterized repeat protein (TIGR03803 family)